MSPAQSRWFFAGFAILLAAVTVNAHRQTPRIDTAVAPQPTDARSVAAPTKIPVASAPPPVASSLPADPRPHAAPAARLPQAQVAARKDGDEPIKLAAVGEPVRIPARLPSAAMVGQLPLPSVVDVDADAIRRLQKELVDAGYGPLVVNGAAGPLTRAAIMAFEYDHAMALTGEASARIIKRLATAGVPAAPPEPDQRRITTQEAEQVVLIVQKSLQSLGSTLTVDGRLGPETEAAIRTFEGANGLKVTGRISADLFGALGRAVARSKGDAG